MIIRLLQLSLAVAILLVPIIAQAKDQGTIWKSAYFLGRGHTGISIADEEEAIFYNPAGLAQGSGIYKKTVLFSPHFELSSATKDLARQISNEGAETADAMRKHVGKPNHFGAYNFTGIILRRAAIGVFTSAELDTMVYKSSEHGLETVDISAEENAGLTFSLAEGFFKNKFMVGFTYKYFATRGLGETTIGLTEAEEINDISAEDLVGIGSGSGADVGFMYKFAGRIKPSLGINIKDVGNTTIVPTEATNVDLDLKQTVNIGFSVEPGTKYSTLRVLVDYHDATGAVISSPYKRMHLGGELSVRDYVGITGGMNQGYLTGGMFFDVRFLRLDLGVYTEEVGQRAGSRADTRYFFKLKTAF